MSVFVRTEVSNICFTENYIFHDDVIDSTASWLSEFTHLDWLRHYAASRKVAGSIPDKVIRFFSIYLILPAALWLWCRLSL
jgi:hypothetical protein